LDVRPFPQVTLFWWLKIESSLTRMDFVLIAQEITSKKITVTEKNSAD
jgi:hypothetical protein